MYLLDSLPSILVYIYPEHMIKWRTDFYTKKNIVYNLYKCDGLSEPRREKTGFFARAKTVKGADQLCGNRTTDQRLFFRK